MQEYLNVLNYFCRTCMRIPDNLIPLFEDPVLSEKITAISTIQLDQNDNLPKKICEECVKNINWFYNFRKLVINNDTDLKERVAALQSKTCVMNSSTTIATEEKSDEISKNDATAQTKRPTRNIKSRTNFKKESTFNKSRSFKNLIVYRKKSYECKTCSFICTEFSKWQQHKRSKHCSRGICNICGKSMRYDNLHKHIRSHTEDPVTCGECGKVFKNSESLRCHTLIHNGPELICNFCGKSYRYRGEYNRHMKRHSCNGKKTVKCPLCDKLFYDKKHVKRHIQTHTGERPHVCGYCRKGFSSTYALKTHVRQHTNEKPFICEYCPMAFPQKVSLMTHIKSKHVQSTEQDV